jgi:hypothetical protein
MGRGTLSLAAERVSAPHEKAGFDGEATVVGVSPRAGTLLSPLLSPLHRIH